MQKLVKSVRSGFYVKYGCTRLKNGMLRIKAKLYDENFNEIYGVSASYTVNANADLSEAKRVAQNRALEKLDSIKLEHLNDEQSGNFFSKLAFKCTDEELNACVSSRRTSPSSRNAAQTYCLRKLALLDKFGPLITPDQCAAIRDQLYLEVLENKRYNAVLCNDERPESIIRFWDALHAEVLNMLAKQSVQGRNAKLESAAEHILDVILKEDRLRSLLNAQLSATDTDSAVSNFIERYEREIRYNWIQGNDRDRIQDSMLFVVRRYCGDENNSKDLTNRHIEDLNDFIANLCRFSTVDVPPISIPLFETDTVRQNELPRDLGWFRRIHLAMIIEKKAGPSNCACAEAVMLTTGPRTAEACALRFGEIIEYPYGGVGVINHTTDGKEVRKTGKNVSFHRPIFLPRFTMDMIYKRKAFLRAQGYTDEQIAKAFLACRSNENIFTPLSPIVFSQETKQDILDAGLDEDYLSAAAIEMDRAQQMLSQDENDRSVSAYILRRDAATVLCNVAHLDPRLVDAILGHKLTKGGTHWDRLTTNKDYWPEILAEMDRIVYLPDHSYHPLFSPIVLNGREDYLSPTAYHGFALQLEGSKLYNIVVEAAGDIIFESSSETVIKAGAEVPYPSKIQPLSRIPTPEDYRGIMNKKNLKKQGEPTENG